MIILLGSSLAVEWDDGLSYGVSSLDDAFDDLKLDVNTNAVQDRTIPRQMSLDHSKTASQLETAHSPALLGSLVQVAKILLAGTTALAMATAPVPTSVLALVCGQVPMRIRSIKAQIRNNGNGEDGDDMLSGFRQLAPINRELSLRQIRRGN